MASGTIEVNNPYNSTTIYNNSSGTNVTSNVTITLNDDATNYKFLVLRLYSGSVSGSTRCDLTVPAITTTACFFPIACGSNLGYVRVERASSSSLTFISTSYSPLLLQSVWGVK